MKKSSVVRRRFGRRWGVEERRVAGRIGIVSGAILWILRGDVTGKRSAISFLG